MRFSREKFIIAFVPALILFSMLTWLICHHAFVGKVPVRTIGDREGMQEIPTDHMAIYYCEDPTSGTLSCVTMVFADTDAKTFFTLSIEGDLLIQYDNALYFVKTLWEHDGQDFLCCLFESLTGRAVDPNDVANIRDLLPEGKKEIYLRCSDIVEFLSTVYADATPQEIPLGFSVHGEYKLLDLPETREHFGV